MFKITTQTIEPDKFKQELLSPSSGGYCSFEGFVRNENDGKEVTALEYEAQKSLCEKEAQKIYDEAKEKFTILDIACVHRIGRCQVGDMAVWVGVSASHRDDAFKACRFVIDEMKKRLPIWKKEFTKDGQENWLNMQETSMKGH